VDVAAMIAEKIEARGGKEEEEVKRSGREVRMIAKKRKDKTIIQGN
jgi:hypothetical protein